MEGEWRAETVDLDGMVNHQLDRLPNQFACGRIIRHQHPSLSHLAQSAPDNLHPERLRRLHGPQAGAIQRAFDQLKKISEKLSAGMFKSPLNQLPEGKFPVKITHYDAGNKGQTVVLTNVANGGVSAADFAIPAGYTEQEPEMRGPPGRRH